MNRFLVICILSIIIPVCVAAQGSWSPPGFDPVFPRTLLDSADIQVIRMTLQDPDRLPLYASVWSNATSAIPSGNSTWEDRATRSMIAREAAFVYLMDRKYSPGTIDTLSQAERNFLFERVTGLLEEMNTDVDVGTFWSFYIPWQHRSKELISYLIAYDLLKGAGASQPMLELSKTRLLTFTANLYQKAMASYTFLNLKFFSYQVNNHSIMTASALGLAAVVFNDHTSTNVNEQPQNWINAGLYNLDNTLWEESGIYPRVSEPDTLAGYAEGPNYFKYAFENAFPFIRSMGNFLSDGTFPATFNNVTRNIRNPWHDPRYDRLYDWMNKIRMPDGGFPSIHDSYMGFGTVIMALSGKPEYNIPNPAFTPDDPPVRTQYLATDVSHGTITDSLFQSLPAAGSLVFRSSWDVSAVYMHFIGKHGIALTGAKSHHQGDASGFSLMAYGELLAVDPGYPGASLAELENKATDHSLILVNGTGPLPPTGELVSTSTNSAYIENCFDTPLLDYGEVRVSYQGAEIARKNLFIRNKYFLLADFTASPSPKNYTFQLHGNGLFGGPPAAATGAFVPDFGNARGVYSRNSVSFLVHTTTAGNAPAYMHETDSMVINGGFRRYTKMLVQTSNTDSTLFLSTLFPYTAGSPQVLPASQAASLTSVRVQDGNFLDLAFCSLHETLLSIHADSTGMNKTVKGNGKINFLSETASGSFASAFIQHGDSLVSGNQTVIRCGKKMDVAWMEIDSALFGGYVSDFDTVRFYSNRPLQVLRGAVSDISYDTVHHMAVAVFEDGGIFLFGSAGLTWVWTGQVNGDWHDPANWQMLGHSSIHGVPGAANNVVIPSGGVNMPFITSDSLATCHDLTIKAGARLTVEELQFLTIEGTLTIETD